MDNSEFETRAFAYPDDSDQDFQDALQASPARQALVDEIRSFNGRLEKIANAIAAPEELARRLKAAAVQHEAEVTDNRVDAAETAARSDGNGGNATAGVFPFPSRWRPSRLVAMAAAVVVAVGVTYSSLFGNQPSAAELEFGQQVVNHVYTELDEIDISPVSNFQVINQVFSSVGGRLPDEVALNNRRITFARPCIVIPQYSSAHLVMEGDRGAVNIIFVNNSPVQQQFSFSEERFEVTVVPLTSGNLILVGEKDEPLREIQQFLADNVAWTI